MSSSGSKAGTGNGAGKELVTRSELEQLEAQRSRPAIGRDFTPGGTAAQTIHEMEEMRRRVRAGFIKGRLDLQQDRAVYEFSFAKVRGKAEYDFERSR